MPRPADDEQLVRDRIVELAREYGRYGYRRVTVLMRMQGWLVNHKRVQRIWRSEGLKVPKRQPKRGELYTRLPVTQSICYPKTGVRYVQ